MRNLPALFADCEMGFFGQHFLIGFPEIAIGETPALCKRNLAPYAATTLLAAVTEHKCQNVAGTAAHDSPQPAFVAFVPNKTPGFIAFEDIIWLGGQQS
jgi:hypothetical protein